jgi:ankyrin repeat protein
MGVELIKAVVDNNIDKVKKLLEPEIGSSSSVIDVNFQENKFGNTALHYAMHLNNMVLAETLLDHGANLRIKNFKGEDPMETFLNFTCYRKIV